MGIKNLYTFLRKNSISAFSEVKLSSLKGSRVAIDTSIYLYKYKSMYGDNWLNSFINFIFTLKKHEIISVFIYDTKSPIEKNQKKEERKQRKKNAENKIQSISRALEEYKDSGIVDPLLLQIMNDKSPIPCVDINIDIIQREMDVLRNHNVNITKSDIDKSKQLLEILNISFYNSVNEAETLSSHLCKHGIVDYVLSDDTDVLVYGTPKFLTKLNISQESVIQVTFENILRDLDLTHEQFVDFCIMCETDYNKNIHRVGNIKAFKLIKKYGSIENIELNEPDLDTSVLNYVRVREIFHVPAELQTEYIIKDEKPNMMLLDQFMNKYNIKKKLKI